MIKTISQLATMNVKTFAARLREAAMKNGIDTPKSLSDHFQTLGMKVSQHTISPHWYGKVVPSSAICVDYAKVLGVSLDWLLDGRDPPVPQLIAQMISTFDRARKEGLFPEHDPANTELIESLTGLSTEQRRIIIDLAKQLKGAPTKT